MISTPSFRSARFLIALSFAVTGPLFGAPAPSGANIATKTEASVPGGDPSPTGSRAQPSVVLDEHTLDKRIAPVLKELKLDDRAREAKVRAILAEYFEQVAEWHRDRDDELKQLWAKWAGARATGHKDEAQAAAVAAKIDEVYASLRPQHDASLRGLAAELSPEQIDQVKDALTKTPGFKRTYDAYLQIVPTLTDAQKAFIREKLLVAREEAMDAIANKEKVDLFKKQKVQIEAYIDEQGYDWKKSYAIFAKKMKE